MVLLHLPCFAFFLLFIILITAFPVSLCQKNVLLFQNCSSPLSCGEKFPSLTYPFWGGNRSRDCGEEGFHVSCLENDILTMNISGQTYRILSINAFTHALTIAPNVLWNDVCPDFHPNLSPFSYVGGEEMAEIPLCTNRSSDESRYRFSCLNSERVYYFFNGSDCERIPAFRSEVDDLTRKDASINLAEVLQKGFTVGYTLNWTACSGCTFSKGLCWHGTNSTEAPPCLCPDGSRDQFPCRAREQNIIPREQNIIQKILIGVGASASCALILCMAYVCKRKRSIGLMLRRKTKEGQNIEEFIKQYGSFAVQRYPYSYIKKMTLSFKDKLGQGGYGTVYRGKLFDGRLVAVKLLNAPKENGEEFINEVMSISRTSHVNVVRLLGFCMEGKRRALVYEYMSNGSLEKYIHCKKSEVMSINQLEMNKLYQISLGVARGLEYLHRGCNTRIMHFDIKPHNILLDEKFCPKISDFGMAKQCKMNESIISIMGARGTIGYIAPELVSRAFGVVSYKSDVYSYGMMILEIVGRRKNVNLDTSHASEVYFPHWAYQHLVIDNDLRLKDVTPEEDEIARKIILVGLWCVQNDPLLRPTMSKAIEMLEGHYNASKLIFWISFNTTNIFHQFHYHICVVVTY